MGDQAASTDSLAAGFTGAEVAPAALDADSRVSARRTGSERPPTDPYQRLTALIGALDSAAARLQEAQHAGEIPAIVGTALHTFGIGSQIALLDTPIDGAGDAAVAAMATDTLRIVYVSLLPGLRSTIERLIGHSIAHFPIPLAQVGLFQETVRTHQPVYLSDAEDVARQALPWLPDGLRRRLLQLIHASSCIIAPLLSRGRVLGIMGMWADDLAPGDAAVLGAFARQAGIALDNTRLFHELEQGRSLLRAVIHTDPSAIAIVTGSSAVVRLANPRLRTLSPRSDLEPLGSSLHELFPPELTQMDDAPGAGLRSILESVRRTGEPVTVRGVHLGAPGAARDRIVSLHVTPIRLPELAPLDVAGGGLGGDAGSGAGEDAAAADPLLLILWDITANVRGEAHLRAQVRRSRGLADAALALERERELPALLDRIARAARELTDANWAGFLLRAAPDAPFEVVGVAGVPAAAAATLHRFVSRLTVLRPLLERGEPLLLADASAALADAESRLFARAGVRALAGTALTAGGGWVTGVLVAGHQQADSFSDEQVALLSALSAQAAAAIERARAVEDAHRRADELEATFRSLTAGVAIYDLQGHLMRMNEAGQLIARNHAEIGESAASRHARFRWRGPDGTPLPTERMPSLRAIRGETFYGADYLVDGENGPETRINASGAPLRGADGAINGAVVVFRNVTAAYQLEHRTHAALDALLQIAEALVAPAAPAHAGEPAADTSWARLRANLHQLCLLTTGVLGCERVLIDLVDPETGQETPAAIVGLNAAQAAAWEAALSEGGAYVPNPQLSWLGDEALARLREGEAVVVDFRELPYRELPNPLAVVVALTVPLLVENRLVGILVLDFGARDLATAAHQYTRREIDLATGVARLAALAVDRQRLQDVAADVEALRQANELKEEFLSIASHELKTPLTVLQARTQATRRRLLRLGQTEAAAQFAPVQSSLDRIQGLVQEMLDASRIVEGRLELSLAPGDLGAMVGAVVHDARESSGRTIVLEGAEADGLGVEADPERLPQVLIILLNNALKYSAPESTVTVAVRRERAAGARRKGRRPRGGAATDARAELIVTIADQGVGIHEDEVGRVFERFFRARTSSARQYGGLGLGLHIAATLMARHEGRIWAQSAGPGQGSTFGIALPARATTEPDR
ncbi:MAG TPA: GAF domain-containing protein [Ktedonobacterales bacterium]|nr:GAF domain-containing protein [Ktedonobacterales bacterium]